MMKTLFLTMTMILSLNVLANDRVTIDDLQSLRLRVAQKSLSADVHYPNYRMGGGNGATREINDCLLLDIVDSDNESPMQLKQEIANSIKVLEGFRLQDDELGRELLPTVKGNHIVFKMTPWNVYVTSVKVLSRVDENLINTISRIMPPTRSGNALAAVNLLYVRGCRL